MTKRLAVLCCHQPAIDPRVRWSAEYAASEGYDVRIFGFNHKPVLNKANFASPEVPEIVFSPNDSNSNGLKLLQRLVSAGILPRVKDTILLGFVCLVLSPLILIWGLIKIITWSLQALINLSKKLLSILRFLPKGQAFLNIAGHLLRQSYHLTLMPIANFPGRMLRFFWRTLTQGRFRPLIEALRGYKWYIFDHSAEYAAILDDHLKKTNWCPDAIHAHDPDTLIAAAILKKKYGCSVVYDAHESGPDAYLIRPKPRYIFSAFERMLMPHVDAAVTVSPRLVDKFNSRYKQKPPFFLLPNTSPKSDLEFKKSPSTNIDRLANGRLRVLFQGGLAPERGIEWIIDEWAHRPPENAALFIRGPMNNYRSMLVDYAQNSSLLGKSIFFLDSIPEHELIAEASQADIGIIPYHSHIDNHIGACPNKLSQYMMAGLAILSTPIPYVEEVLNKSGAGIVYDDTKRSDFTKAISKIMEEAHTLPQMKALARQSAHDWFNYEAYAYILPGLYNTD